MRAPVTVELQQTVIPEELKFARFCNWAGLFMLACYIGFWGIMGSMIPPWGADQPAAFIAKFYREHQYIFRAGMIAMLTFQSLYLVWGLGIAQVMRKATGEKSVLIEMEIWGAGLTTAVGLVTMWTWLTGTFRPEALPDVQLQYIYDSGWFIFDMTYAVTSLQMLAFGIGFLQDKRAVPLVPKWACWYSIWVAFMFVAECLMPFFKSGPFSRSGILNFWIEFTIFFFYLPIVSYYMLRAIPRLEKEAQEAA
jgi:hypothetical protein